MVVFFYWTVVTEECGAMFLLRNCQLSDMFRPYRSIIRLYKIKVLDKVNAVVLPAGFCGLQFNIQSNLGSRT